ncbi:MAG: eda [Crocinitomicaceae bacterium]|jgi:2-dehydro-3-deoxyphosphogluconate aldolase/(4S)-4-hydroxy-2-oxoglutarate aldolase|nr:eda [Crocinitomicaceae bacterium]
MTTKQNNIRGILSDHPIIPVVTFNDLREIDPLIEKLLAMGIHCIEITLRTKIAFDAVRAAKELHGNKIAIGVGTITHPDHILTAEEIGVDFMVSPGLSDELIQAFDACSTAFIPGVATPSEIIRASQHGWDTFKFFPAHLFGGAEALKAYGQLFPHVKFCPTGGINESTYTAYSELNNVISVGGSWMVK